MMMIAGHKTPNWTKYNLPNIKVAIAYKAKCKADFAEVRLSVQPNGLYSVKCYK